MIVFDCNLFWTFSLLPRNTKWSPDSTSNVKISCCSYWMLIRGWHARCLSSARFLSFLYIPNITKFLIACNFSVVHDIILSSTARLIATRPRLLSVLLVSFRFFFFAWIFNRSANSNIALSFARPAWLHRAVLHLSNKTINRSVPTLLSACNISQAIEACMLPHPVLPS